MNLTSLMDLHASPHRLHERWIFININQKLQKSKNQFFLLLTNFTWILTFSQIFSPELSIEIDIYA